MFVIHCLKETDIHFSIRAWKDIHVSNRIPTMLYLWHFDLLFTVLLHKECVERRVKTKKCCNGTVHAGLRVNHGQ